MVLVAYDLRDGAAWVTLNDAGTGNAFTPQLADALFAAVRRAQHDEVGVIVLRAVGRFFSVGGDLNGFATAGDLPDHMADLATHAHRIVAELTRSDMIVVSLVEGTAAGIGFPLAMAADLVIAADTAKFTLGYTRVGLTGDGGTGLLARSIGLHRTLRLALLNDALTAHEAYAEGLLARVFPADEVEERTREIVTLLVAGSRPAQAGIKRNVRAAATDDLETQLAQEARTITAATRHPDAVEGASAFLEKRKPRFRD